MESNTSLEKGEGFQETIAFLEDVARDIDFNVLRRIVEKTLVKAGGDLRHINNLSPSAITVTVDQSNPRRKASRPNRGRVSTMSLNAVRWQKELKSHPPEFVRVSALKTIFHELVHILASQHYVSTSGVWKGSGVPRTGFRHKRWFTGYGDMFNEGVTDRIAIEWLHEYLQSVSHKDLKEIPVVLGSMMELNEGTAQSHFVSVGVVAHIAKEIGIPEKDVWNSLVKHNFTSGISRDVRESLNKIFGRLFSNRLGKAEDPRETHIVNALWKYMRRPSREEVLSRLTGT